MVKKIVTAQFYRMGLRGLRWLVSFEPIARPLEDFARVLQRHRKLYAHLRTQHFDAIIDGGANIGEFAQITRAALPAADLLCVEPNHECATALRERRFRVVEVALWNMATELTLMQPTSASTSCTVLLGDRDPDRTTRKWVVPAVRLDSLQISGSRVLVKLDLQGAEMQALEGMGELWRRCAGLLLEVSFGADGTYERLRKMLADHGFHEASTTNELWENGRVIEADKLWLRNA
ncbi:MAG: FkbM family methyltransferase [Verrucomicrobiota bacterium]